MNADTLYQQAQDAIRNKDYAQARELLRAAVKDAPLRTDVRELLAYAIEQEGRQGTRKQKNPAKSARTGEQPLLPKRTKSKRLVVLSAILFVCLILFAAGIYAWLRLSPAPQQDLMEMVAPETPEAVATPEPTPDPREEQRRQLMLEAAALLEAEQPRRALEKLQGVLETEPPDPEIIEDQMAECHFALGEAAYEEKDYDESIDHFTKATELNPAYSQAFFWVGQASYRKGALSRGSEAKKALQNAKTALEKAIAIAPDQLKSYDTLALTHIKLGDSVTGARYYEEIIQRAPGSPEAIKAERQLQNMQMR